MKDYIFIYGKNPNLSLAEIVSYLEPRNNFAIKDYSDAFVVISADELPVKIMDDLGGTLKIAEVIFSTDKKDAVMDAQNNLNFDEIFKELPDKVIFGVSSYTSKNEQLLFSEMFKDKLKEKKIRAGYMHLPKNRSALSHVEVIRKKLIEDSFEVVTCAGKRFYLGRTIYIHNPFEFQKRDIKRPVQRTIYTIPPRLCKIMINLSKAKQGILLDPFCGIGSILQEATLMGYSIMGYDIDAKAVGGCLKNMEWLEKEYNISIGDLRKKIRLGDARNVDRYLEPESVDAIATEPYLGPPLRKHPTREQAQRIFDEVGPLFEKSISAMIKILKPKSRIVIVSPVFDTDKGQFSLDIEKIAENNNAKIIDPFHKYKIPHTFPLMDYEERHKTIRRINIIEKN